MKAATPSWIGTEQCQSRQFFAAIKVGIAQHGAMMKPRRSAGSMHFEKVPT